MTTDRKPQILGTFIRARRLSRELTLSDAAGLSGLHVSYWSKLETGHYKAPLAKESADDRPGHRCPLRGSLRPRRV